MDLSHTKALPKLWHSVAHIVVSAFGQAGVGSASGFGGLGVVASAFGQGGVDPASGQGGVGGVVSASGQGGESVAVLQTACGKHGLAKVGLPAVSQTLGMSLAWVGCIF